MFDNITKDDFIMAFYPCIYFSCQSQSAFRFAYNNYRKLTDEQKIEKILERDTCRSEFYQRLLRFVGVCINRNIRMVFENPWTTDTYLKANFVKSPDVVDNNRMLRGDYFVKPTAYWFFNCEPTHGLSIQNDKKKRRVIDCKQGIKAGVCSEERSLISPDYARNFIHDFIIGKKQKNTELTLFDI